MGECQTYGRLLCDWSHSHSISKLWSDNQYHFQGRHHIRITIGDIPHCTCPDFTKMSSKTLERKDMGVLQISLLCV
jgi:hypothetical protein